MSALRWCIRGGLLVTFFMPWWYPLVACAVVGFITFNFFWEGIFVLCLYDLLFGVSIPQFGGFPFALTAAGLGITALRYVLLKFLWRRPPTLLPLSKSS